MRSVMFLACAVLALAAVLPASADHGCNGTVVTVSAGSGAVYLDDRSERTGDVNLWMYVEDNNVEGLQSGGDSAIFEDNGPPLGDIPPFSDGCAHPNPDRLIF